MTAEPEPAIANPEKQLAWERRHRPRAAIAVDRRRASACSSSTCSSRSLQRDMPTVSGLETFMRAARARRRRRAAVAADRRSSSTWTPRRAGLLIGMASPGSSGCIGLAWAVGFLGVATRARSPAFRQVHHLPADRRRRRARRQRADVAARQRCRSSTTSWTADRTVRPRPTPTTALIVYARLLYLLGTLALAVGLVLVSLNAMRVGLLTRMLGYIGIVVGRDDGALPAADRADLLARRARLRSSSAAGRAAICPRGRRARPCRGRRPSGRPGSAAARASRRARTGAIGGPRRPAGARASAIAMTTSVRP